MAIAMTDPSPAVVVTDAGVTIHDLVETDAEVVHLVGDADDPQDAVHRCLQIGARATQLVQTTLDTEIVEKHFDLMTRNFEDGVDEAVTKVTQATVGLLGEEGFLRKVLAGWRSEVETVLGDTFDENSKKSVMAKVERLISDLIASNQEAIAQLIDPHGKDSPLKKVKDDLDASLRREVGEVKSVVVELAERIAVKKAQEETMEFSAKKGFAYEDVVHDIVCHFAATFGDTAAKVGTAKGIDGNQRGDEVVAINVEDTFGVPERYVLEVKDRRLSFAETHDQLGAAMSNREAKAGVAVFSSQALAPTTVPFQYSSDKAIAVLDKSDLDGRNLRLACTWARWVVRRRLAEPVDGVDVERVEAHLADAALALKKLSKLKGCHTAAKRSIDQAGAIADALKADIDEAIEAVRAELDQ